VRVWDDAKQSVRRGLRVDEAGALPVFNGDGVRVDVRLNREAYVYLVWVDARGETQPVYPWDPVKNEDWKTPMPPQRPTAHLSLPAPAGEGFILDGPRGLETMVLLARSTPLEPGLSLHDLVGRLPPAPLVDPREVSWVELTPGRKEAWHPRPAQHRGIKLGQSKQLDEPVLRLLEKLRPHFELLKAVRFAHAEP
jgi:hypothetical protein